MAEPRIVFEPHAGAVERDIVEEIINRRNVRLTGHDDWYPGLTIRIALRN